MRANCSELNAIRKVINLYVEGVRTCTDGPLENAFHPKASLYGYFGDAQHIAPIQALYDAVTAQTAPAKTGEPFECVISSISVFGDVASVEVTMDSWQGHDFVDYFQLMKVDGRWWIMSKLFHGMARSTSTLAGVDEPAAALSV